MPSQPSWWSRPPSTISSAVPSVQAAAAHSGRGTSPASAGLDHVRLCRTGIGTPVVVFKGCESKQRFESRQHTFRHSRKMSCMHWPLGPRPP
eukprot:2481240-Prymnesium_polylepis.1